MKIVAVSACPLGLMHTYMAAERLEEAAKKRDIEVKVETHGAIGIEHRLTIEDIASSDYVILMTDISINEKRFGGKDIISVSTAYAISHIEEILDRIGG